MLFHEYPFLCVTNIPDPLTTFSEAGPILPASRTQTEALRAVNYLVWTAWWKILYQFTPKKSVHRSGLSHTQTLLQDGLIWRQLHLEFQIPSSALIFCLNYCFLKNLTEKNCITENPRSTETSAKTELGLAEAPTLQGEAVHDERAGTETGVVILQYCVRRWNQTHINTWWKNNNKQKEDANDRHEFEPWLSAELTKASFLKWIRGNTSHKDHWKICAISFSAQMLLNWIQIRE